MLQIKTNAHGLTALFTALLAGISGFALLYAHWQLREAHEQAQVQHLLSMEKEYAQEPMVTYRKVCATKRLAGVNDPPEETRMLDFFGTVGLLVNRGYLKDTDVWETFANDVFPLYADARDTIEQDRKSDPAEYSNLVSLVGRLESIENEHRGALARPSKEEIADYWRDEAAAGVGTPTKRHKHPAPAAH